MSNGVFSIGDCIVGPGRPTFVIAEAGVNHDGQVAEARALVQLAKRAGADCVKFQTFKAERVASALAPKASYQMKTTDAAESQVEMLRRLELPEAAHAELVRECAACGIAFMSTPYNREDADFLHQLGVPAFKLASIHVAEPDFVHYVAAKGKPVILSTGMATLGEVDEAVRAVREAGNSQCAILQCTTNYPSALEEANLRAMLTMRDAFDAVVGYSDHTEGEIACVAAVAMGACVIEKHFTRDRRRAGPDHAASLEPEAFASLVRSIRQVEASLGNGRKEPSPSEKANAPAMRRSLVAARPLAAGEVLSASMLVARRPGTGLRPALLPDIVGKRLARDVAAGEMLAWDAIAGSDG